MKDDPYHSSSAVELVLLVVKLVFAVTVVSVVKLVFAVTSFEVNEALDLELFRVVIGVVSGVLIVVFLASGDAALLGEAIVIPLSTL